MAIKKKLSKEMRLALEKALKQLEGDLAVKCYLSIKDTLDKGYVCKVNKRGTRRY